MVPRGLISCLEAEEVIEGNIYCARVTSTSTVNGLLSSNISILIGPMETSAVVATQPLCIRARVPQIAPLTSLETLPVDSEGTSYLVRMNPTEALRAKVIAEIMKHYKWQTMAVLGSQEKEGMIEKFLQTYTDSHIKYDRFNLIDFSAAILEEGLLPQVGSDFVYFPVKNKSFFREVMKKKTRASWLIRGSK